MISHEIIAFLLAAFICIAGGAPFPGGNCPTDCVCTNTNPDGHLSVRCTSLTFLDMSAELNGIDAIDLSRLNLTKIGSKLKKLHSLRSVDLSRNHLREAPTLKSLTRLTHLNLHSNHIKHLDAEVLPKSIQHLDLSGNYLGDIPEGLLDVVPRLTHLNLAGNPFVCSCDLKNKCDVIVSRGVLLVKPVTCRDRFQGHVMHVSELDCSADSNDLELMQGDQPEGSGEEPEVHEDVAVEARHPGLDAAKDIVDEELLPTRETDQNDGDIEDEEGSGDEGSGDDGFIGIIPTDETPLKACNFDCATPLSIEDDTNTTEASPNLIDELGKVFGDFISDSDEDPDPTSDETEVTEEPMVVGIAPKSDAGIPIQIAQDEKDKMAIIDAETAEVQDDTSLGISNNIIIVIALLVVMVCIVVYSVLMKRRKGRKRRPSSTLAHAQEMKPLKSLPASREPQEATDGPAEKVPLMNGQNGNTNMNGNGKPVDGEPVDEEQPLMRSQQQQQPPEATQRVTVHAKELTTPKTPMLVNRMRSHDGNIITTPGQPQHP